MKEITEDLLDSDKVSSKLIELEDRSRRNNLGTDSIVKTKMKAGMSMKKKCLK